MKKLVREGSGHVQRPNRVGPRHHHPCPCPCPCIPIMIAINICQCTASAKKCTCISDVTLSKPKVPFSFLFFLSSLPGLRVGIGIGYQGRVVWALCRAQDDVVPERGLVLVLVAKFATHAWGVLRTSDHYLSTTPQTK